MLLSNGYAQPVSVADTLAEKLYSSAMDIRLLDVDKAANQYPVRLKGVITYCDDAWSTAFVQDETAGIFINTGCSEYNIQTGDIVEISGATGPGEFVPVVVVDNIVVRGKGELPEPKAVGLERLFSGLEDSQFVYAWGTVHSVERMQDMSPEEAVNRNAKGGHPLIKVVNDQRVQFIVLPADLDTPLPTHLIDSSVRIAGVAATLFNRQRQLMGVRFFVSDLSQIKILSRQPGDPYSKSPSPIISLKQFDPSRKLGHRVHVKGSVLLQYSPTEFYIRDETGATLIETVDTLNFNRGDFVSVAGFISSKKENQHTSQLIDAIAKKIHSGDPPMPLEIDAHTIIADFHDAEYVKIKGELVKIENRINERTLLINAGDYAFRAYVADESIVLSDLKPGAVLSLTGITTLEVSDNGQRSVSYGFSLRLADRASIAVLSEPPWLTPRKLLAAVGILMGIILLGTIWMNVLQMKVNQQTNVINEKMNQEVRLREAAQAANKAKGEFLSVMSHEIRTPMNGIVGMTSLLESTRVNHEQKEYIDIIKRSSDALLSIMNSILNYSRIESGKHEVRLINFSLSQLVQEVTSRVEKDAIRQSVILKTAIDTSVPELIHGDESSLNQILEILLSNALKFTREGEVLITASSEKVEYSGIRLTLCVKDSGIGIAADKLETIFEPFSQADSSYSRKFEGAGLGLAICRRLCTQLGGDISVESEVGLGATFTITATFMEAAQIEDETVSA